MDKGVVFLLCVLYMALSHVPITNAEWRGNVCNEKKTEYVEERSCANYISRTCLIYKTKMTSRVSYYKSCCPEWHHNGDQNCNIPICSPVCQKDWTCVAPYKCERTLDQADKNMTFAIGGPDNITFMPDKAIIHEFGALNITCLTNCDMFCSFQWIKYGNSDNEETVVADLATMQISNATRRDAGNYSCRAMNRVTNKTVVDSITLEVIYNDDLGWNSSTDMTETNPPLSDNDDLGRNSTTDITERKPPLSETISALFLTYILPGTAVILTCFNCGIFAYKSRKRFCKRRNIISIPAGAIIPGADPANSNEIGMVDIDINPVSSYWTIGEDNTLGPCTIEDKTGAPKSADVGSKSRQIKHNNPPDKPNEICLQSYEDAYLHPI